MFAQMKRKRISLFMLLLFSTSIVSATLGAALHESTTAYEELHIDGSSCPDPDLHDHPCGPSCPCTCCPGHVTAVAVASVQFLMAARFNCKQDAVSPSILHLKEIPNGVFRPPRA